MNILFLVLIFAFGLVIGSFLNSVIWRLEQGESVLRGKSYCPKCRHPLAWYDLLPLASFFLLRGRCRYCVKPISWQYPLVEISTALVFLLILNSQFSILNEFSIIQLLKLFSLWFIASTLIVIFVYDLKHYIIPDGAVYAAIAAAFLYQALSILEIGSWELANSLLSAASASAFFFALHALSRGKWLGFGDVKLAFFMGLFLGFPLILAALFVAFLSGAAAGVLLIACRKKKMQSEVPFGPFLVAGTLAALFFGDALVDWYLQFLVV